MRPARCVPRSSTQSPHDIASPSSASTGMSLLPKRTLPPMRTTRGSDGSRTRRTMTDANTSMNAMQDAEGVDRRQRVDLAPEQRDGEHERAAEHDEQRHRPGLDRAAPRAAHERRRQRAHRATSARSVRSAAPSAIAGARHEHADRAHAHEHAHDVAGASSRRPARRSPAAAPASGAVPQTVERSLA